MKDSSPRARHPSAGWIGFRRVSSLASREFGMGPQPLRIVVAGSGIGGLTAAIALQAKGFEVDVYDQASELSEIGAGVSIGGNGMRVLDDLGLGRAVRDVSSNLQRIEFHHWHSGEIF